MSEGGQKLTPELGKKIAERTQPVIPMWHDFLDAALSIVRGKARH